MGFNKKFYQTGGLVASSATPAPAAFDPLQNFETVTYTGNGSTQKITGYIRKGAAFNGSSSYIDIPTIPNITGSGSNFSFSAWINFDGSSGDRYIMSFRENSYIELGFNSGYSPRKLEFKVNDGANKTVLVNESEITYNTWHHVCLTAESSGNLIAYLDGNPKGTIAIGSIGNSGGQNSIGAYSTGTPAGYFTGKIDQVRIFNTALNPTQVGELALETYADPKKSTTDYFGDGSGVALYELDDSAFVSDNNPNAGFQIDSGQSATFNGSSGFINLGSTNQFQANGVTVSMWVNPNNVTTSQILIGNSDGGSFAEGDLYVVLRSDGYIGYQIGQNASIYEARHATTTQLSIGNWYHITATFDSSLGTTIGKIYVNGILQSTTATYAAGGTFSGDVFIGTLPLQLGKRNISGNELWYNGKIDQVRIYSTALNNFDVIKLYTEYNVPTSNLVSHYKLDGNASDSVGTYDGFATSITYTGTVPQIPYHPYNGTATNVNYLGMAFQPDLVWVKKRSSATNSDHLLNDSVRGVNKILYPNLPNQEDTAGGVGSAYLNSFDSNGFTVGSSTYYNGNGETYVAWCWKAGGAVTPNNNTDGTIVSTVSANPDAGFSIVSTQSDGSGYLNFGHGLSQAPELVITKFTSQSGEWYTYTSAISNGFDVALKLNSADAAITAYGTNKWSATSTVVAIGNPQWYFTANVPFITYCFHSVDGYQKVGSYTSDNQTTKNISVGFRPRFLLLKNTAGGNWLLVDNLRGGNELYANTNALDTPEASIPTFYDDGFTLHNTRYNGGTTDIYIYLAIA